MRKYSLKNTAGAQVQASLLFSSAFLLTEGKLICETWTMADRDDPGLKEKHLWPSEACCAFVPQLSAPCFLLVS